ncbi:MAG TPA: SGNH/GDSL hydrolase family protein [Verrucomicrobiae bacterium]|nr:SGNH/GDSL hydrolase family protein [Verrucomicrobiae bacterium]
MKNLCQFTAVILFFGAVLFPAHADYSSLYIFGDALSTTTNNQAGGSQYYGKRYSNGRVWVEVLAQRQGITYEPNKNNSYYDHNSATLRTQINSLPAANYSNDLFIVWVCNADTFDSASDYTTGTSNAIFGQWQAANNLSQANHLNIITNLYAKGVRNLILPNAVDISKVPGFNGSSDPTYSPFVGVMHAGCIDFNLKFSNTVNQAKALRPGLNIYSPDFFTLLNNVLTNAAYYGLSNYTENGLSVAARDSTAGLAATNGYGANFVYWDYLNPTAKFHAVIADEAQKLLPQEAQITNITPAPGGCQLQVKNWPGGLNGFVEGVTNLALANWTTNLAGFTSTNTTPSIFVPASSPQWFYRLRIPYYPYAWSWP